MAQILNKGPLVIPTTGRIDEEKTSRQIEYGPFSSILTEPFRPNVVPRGVEGTAANVGYVFSKFLEGVTEARAQEALKRESSKANLMQLVRGAIDSVSQSDLPDEIKKQKIAEGNALLAKMVVKEAGKGGKSKHPVAGIITGFARAVAGGDLPKKTDPAEAIDFVSSVHKAIGTVPDVRTQIGQLEQNVRQQIAKSGMDVWREDIWSSEAYQNYVKVLSQYGRQPAADIQQMLASLPSKVEVSTKLMGTPVEIPKDIKPSEINKHLVNASPPAIIFAEGKGLTFGRWYNGRFVDENLNPIPGRILPNPKIEQVAAYDKQGNYVVLNRDAQSGTVFDSNNRVVSLDDYRLAGKVIEVQSPGKVTIIPTDAQGTPIPGKQQTITVDPVAAQSAILNQQIQQANLHMNLLSMPAQAVMSASETVNKLMNIALQQAFYITDKEQRSLYVQNAQAQAQALYDNIISSSRSSFVNTAIRPPFGYSREEAERIFNEALAKVNKDVSANDALNRFLDLLLKSNK